MSSLDRGTAMSIAFLTIGLMLLIVAPITWFSGQWRTPVVMWWRRIRHQSPLTAMPVLNQPAEDVVRFRECLPQIELCQRLIGQSAGQHGGLYMWIMSLRNSFAEDITTTTLIKELEYLTRSLDPLGIRCPAVYGAKDELPSDVLVRLRIWNRYLTELTVMIQHDDLVQARQLEPPDSTKPPTPDKSDALC